MAILSSCKHWWLSHWCNWW